MRKKIVTNQKKKETETNKKIWKLVGWWMNKFCERGLKVFFFNMQADFMQNLFVFSVFVRFKEKNCQWKSMICLAVQENRHGRAWIFFY